MIVCPNCGTKTSLVEDEIIADRGLLCARQCAECGSWAATREWFVAAEPWLHRWYREAEAIIGRALPGSPR